MRKFLRLCAFNTAIAALLPSVTAFAQLDITTDYLQNGGTLTVSPEGTLQVADSVNPLLTLTAGATTSGVTGVAVGVAAPDLSAQAGRVEINGGSKLTNSGSAVIGERGASYGEVVVRGTDSEWTNAGQLTVANDVSYGYLTIEDGARVTSFDGLVGNLTGRGTVTVQGADARWEVSNRLTLGQDQGVGWLYIKDGGYVSNNRATLGASAYSYGVVAVSDPGSHWQTVSLDIGEQGHGELVISDGGKVSTMTDARIGRAGFAVGSVHVTGADSYWQIDNLLTVGDGGHAILTIDQAAKVKSIHTTVRELGTLAGNGGTIASNVTNLAGTISPGSDQTSLLGELTIEGNFNQHSAGKTLFQIAGTAEFDRLVVTRDAWMNGMIEIDLLEGFSPTPGDSFALFEFRNFYDQGFHFDFSEAPLANPAWSWDTTMFSTNGTITVVPEPSSFVLAALALLAGMLLRRKRTR